MSGQIVQNEQHPERRQRLGEGDPDGESLLPALPAPPKFLGAHHLGRFGERGKDCCQFRLEPGMEHRVGAGAPPLDPHEATGRMEERELLGGARADILVFGWPPP